MTEINVEPVARRTAIVLPLLGATGRERHGLAHRRPTEAASVNEDTDRRYRNLLGAAAWNGLPLAVRRRFGRRLEPGHFKIYNGEVVATEMSLAGRLLAHAARLVGAPLPLVPGGTGAAVVSVSEEPALGGQVWTRIYQRPGRFPQVINSAKRFRGATGLEEHLGRGLVMRLRLRVENDTLVFRSAGYAIEIGGRAIPLPAWLSPGVCEVRHRPETDDRFSFTLTLTHPLLGRLIHQVAFFRDPNSCKLIE